MKRKKNLYIKKVIGILLILIMSGIIISEKSESYTNEDLIREINPYNNKHLTIMKGAFLKGVSQRQLSSEALDIGDEVTFINPQNIYADEDIIIPEGAIYVGFVEDVKEPVQGTNGALKIKIYKVIYPDNSERKINAYVGSSAEQYLGGDKSPYAYYERVPHYSSSWGTGVLQYAPVNVFEYGKPIIVKAGRELNIVLVEDFSI